MRAYLVLQVVDPDGRDDQQELVLGNGADREVDSEAIGLRAALLRAVAVDVLDKADGRLGLLLLDFVDDLRAPEYIGCIELLGHIVLYFREREEIRTERAS